MSLIQNRISTSTCSMKVERFCLTNVSYPEPYINFTYSPLFFPEYIMKVERIFDNTTGYSFLAEVSCESLFKIIWYNKSNESEYQTNKFIFRVHLYLILYYRSRFFWQVLLRSIFLPINTLWRMSSNGE